MAYQMKTVYLGDLMTEGTHLKSGKKIITDAPPDNNGKGSAYSPTDTVCAALCACMMTIMGIVARRENIDITGLEGDIEKLMSVEAPRRIVEIRIDFLMPEKVIMSDKQKTMLKNAAKTCPVALSLNPEIKQVVSFNF